MKRWLIQILIAIILPVCVLAQGSKPGIGPRPYIIQLTDCSGLSSFGMLCHDTDDGTLWKWNGTSVEKVATLDDPFASGLYSAIPATCTEPNTYWATDTNILYICTATNTWTASGPTFGSDVAVGTTTAGKNLTVNATLGTELLVTPMVTGGWDQVDGWSVAGGSLVKVAGGGTGTATANATGMPTAPIATPPTTYKVVIVCSAVSGTLTYSMGGVTGTTITATTITDYITATATTRIAFSGGAAVTATITSVSVKALTDATGDLTVDGNLTAHSLATFDGGVTVTRGQVLLPDGSVSAPSLVRSTNPDTGFYFGDGAGEHTALTINGVQAWTFRYDSLYISSTSASINFGGDNVISRDAANILQLGVDAATATAQTLKGPNSTGAGIAGGQLNFLGGTGGAGGAVGAVSISGYKFPTAICTTGYILQSDGTNLVCSNTLTGTFDIGDSVATGHAVTMDANGALQTAFTNLLPDANDGAALGSTSYMWSDLFLASGAVINWNNGADTITHSGTADITIDLVDAAKNSTLAITNSAATYFANLTVDGNISAATYASDGSVTDAELKFINTLSSNAQDQLNAKMASAGTGLVERIGATFDGGGSAILVNKVAYTHVPFAVTTINSWVVQCDVDSGATGIIVTPYLDAYAEDTHPTTTMCTSGTAPHTTDGAGAGGMVHKANWDCNITAIPADSMIMFKVTTAPTASTLCSVTLKITR